MVLVASCVSQIRAVPGLPHAFQMGAERVGIAAAGEILIAAVESFQGRDRDFACVSIVQYGGGRSWVCF